MKDVIEVVAGVIYNDDNKILLAKRKSSKFENLYEFPGGKIEFNETKEQALVREIKEELNLDINIMKFICTVEHEYDDFKLIMHTYACTTNNTNIKLNVHSDIKWINVSEIQLDELVPADIKVLKYLI